MVLRRPPARNELRQANGRIEELENPQRRLEDQFEGAGRTWNSASAARRRRSVVAPPGGLAALAADRRPAVTLRPPPSRAAPRAFDPDADPNAPGAPRPLGTTSPSAPIAGAPPAGDGPPLDALGTRRLRPSPPTCPAAVPGADHLRRGVDSRRAAPPVQRGGRRLSGRPVRAGRGGVQGFPRRQRRPSAGARRDLLSRRDLFPALAAARGGRAISQGFHRLSPSRRARQRAWCGSASRLPRSATTIRPARPSPNSASATRPPRRSVRSRPNAKCKRIIVERATPAGAAVGRDRLAFRAARRSERALLAVSGGPDSTALLLMAASWARRRGGRPRLEAATVDHGLRAESADGGAAVAELCETARRSPPHSRLARRQAEEPHSGARARGALRAARRMRAKPSARMSSSPPITSTIRRRPCCSACLRGSGDRRPARAWRRARRATA